MYTPEEIREAMALLLLESSPNPSIESFKDIIRDALVKYDDMDVMLATVVFCFIGNNEVVIPLFETIIFFGSIFRETYIHNADVKMSYRDLISTRILISYSSSS